MNKNILLEYDKKKFKIKKRLKEFKSVWEESDKRVFSELCFCICTPQSKAIYCDRAIVSLKESGALFKGDLKEIRAGLKAVRFPNNKARYILESRGLFGKDDTVSIKNKIDTGDILKTREWLAKNVKGLGLKEASHFLRNIGFGSDLAILDVHILKNMVRYGIIGMRPKSLTKAKYLSLEDKLRKFAGSMGIPMDELDLLFWSSETGEIFK